MFSSILYPSFQFTCIFNLFIYIYIERERVVGISCYYGKDHAGLKIHFNTYSKYKSYEYIYSNSFMGLSCSQHPSHVIWHGHVLLCRLNFIWCPLNYCELALTLIKFIIKLYSNFLSFQMVDHMRLTRKIIQLLIST